MADVLRLSSVFALSRTEEYTISGEVWGANGLYITVKLWNPQTNISTQLTEIVGTAGWSRFESVATVDGSQFTGLIIERQYVGPNIAQIPGGFTTTYFRNISATYLAPALVSTTDILNAGRLNQAYNGCKISALDFNIPSPDTPDGGPVVEINFVNPNAPTAAPTELEELDVALETARMPRALVNVAGEPIIYDPLTGEARRFVNIAQQPPIPSSDRMGRALVNIAGQPPIQSTDRMGRRLVNIVGEPPPPIVTDEARALVNRGESTSTQRAMDPGRILVNRGDTQRAVDPARALANRSGERRGRRLVNKEPGRALVNRYADPGSVGRARRLVNRSAAPGRGFINRSVDPGRALFNRTTYIDPATGFPAAYSNAIVRGNPGLQNLFARRLVN